MTRKRGKLNGALKGKPWLKPKQSALVVDVAHMMTKHGEISETAIHKKTTLAKTTIRGVRERTTFQPHPTTLQLILRCYGKELVIRDKGSNE